MKTKTPKEIEDYLRKQKGEKNVKEKTRSNVGIFPIQIVKIKLLIKEGKYKSINHFVIEAVEEKLEKELSGGEE